MKLYVHIFFFATSRIYILNAKVLQASILDSATAYSYSGFPENDTAMKKKIYSSELSLSNEGLLPSVSSSPPSFCPNGVCRSRKRRRKGEGGIRFGIGISLC